MSAVITVRNRQRKLSVAVSALQEFAEAALLAADRMTPHGARKLASLAEVGVSLVSDRRIADLHRRFMDIAGPTDVITFEHGEIFVSVETALRQAGEYETTLDHELRLYIVHGILHLLGFDDTTATAAQRMSDVQERLVATLSAA